ncbi:hypothetical protein AB0K09_04215 [Streptomyces sp. NPDC049577]|uniref:hypothetical protein n=1 Tax=Streptomyces sp. NPDC049577 TaxID=3155153 RepID=UPI003417D392
MTVLAVIALAIWMAGIAIIAVLLPRLRQENAEFDAAFVVDPVRACLASAVVIVAWPGALLVVGISRLVERRNR